MRVILIVSNVLFEIVNAGVYLGQTVRRIQHHPVSPSDALTDFIKLSFIFTQIIFRIYN